MENALLTTRPSVAAPPLSAPARRTLVIDSRLNGPRRSANGGFAAGTIASTVDADTVTVVLRRPVPLDASLDVLPNGGDAVEIVRRGTVIAEARPGRLEDGPVPVAPSLHDAFLARAAHPLYGVRHPLSDCVVCGPERRDGMHVTPGPVPGRPELLATPWIVAANVSSHGIATYPAVWAALDCPSYPAAALDDGTLCLLGTMTARVDRRPRVGETLVVCSWTREQHGRRYETSAVIVDEHGDVVARGDSTWIAVKHQRLPRLIRLIA